MVLTALQTTAFFEDNDQMGLAHRTRVFLQSEGIDDVEDLEEFITKDSWSQVLENCKRPPRIPDPAGGGGLVEDQAYRIGAKSLRRLKVAAKAVAYYLNTGRVLTAATMTWSPRLATFELAWRAIEEQQEKDSSNKLPVLHRNFAIERWIESYINYSDQRIGVRMCPLSYVLRDEAAVPAPAPNLEVRVPYSALHGSIKAEMVARYSHTHALFAVDNASIFDDIEEATRGSKYSATISPFRRPKDGRGAFMALKEQHTGPAMWDKKKSTAMEFLQSRKFTGTTTLTLEAFLGQHRAAYVTLQRCADNVNCQLPDDRSRVQYLLDNIQVDDSNVKAALSSIRMDDTPTGRRNNFESAVAFLLPTDPVTKKGKNKRPSAEISATTGNPKSLGTHKPGRGETGVEFRYYEPKEFRKLTQEQKDELMEHRKKKGQGSPGKGARSDKQKSRKSKFNAAVSSAVKKELNGLLGSEEEDEPKDERRGKDLTKYMGEALVASLRERNKSKAAVSALSPLRNKQTAISAIAPAMRPAAKLKVSKPKHTTFAEELATSADSYALEQEAEVAASKLISLIRRMDKGVGKTP